MATLKLNYFSPSEEFSSGLAENFWVCNTAPPPPRCCSDSNMNSMDLPCFLFSNIFWVSTVNSLIYSSMVLRYLQVLNMCWNSSRNLCGGWRDGPWIVLYIYPPSSLPALLKLSLINGPTGSLITWYNLQPVFLRLHEVDFYMWHVLKIGSNHICRGGGGGGGCNGKTKNGG